MSEQDPYDLQRFVDAQENVYERALSEIKSGRKQSHWMWFIFPQIEGLGISSISRHTRSKALRRPRRTLPIRFSERGCCKAPRPPSRSRPCQHWNSLAPQTT